MRRAAVRIDPLYVTQAAIAACEAHVGGTQVVPFGLLVGTACVCPRTKIEYLLLDEVLPARIELTPDEPDTQLAAELRDLATVAESRDKLVLGWYLGGMDEVLRLDAELERLHRDLFPEPWQVALVRSRGTEPEQGAFLRLDPMAGRFYPVPFFELSPDSAQNGVTEGLRTGVAWATYRTQQPVLPLSATSPAPAQPVETSIRRWLGSFRSRPATANSPSSSIRPPAGRHAFAPRPRSEAPPDVPFEPHGASVNASPVQMPAPALTPTPPQSASLTEERAKVVEMPDPPAEVAFPALPEEAGGASRHLPTIERRRLVLFGITALMLLEALWLLSILR
jgi:hypothetical protein